MAFKDTSIVWKVNIVFQVIAFIISLAGFGSNDIVRKDFWDVSLYGGLWTICFYSPPCWSAPDFLLAKQLDSEWLSASRALMAISITAHFVGMLMSVASAVMSNPSKIMFWILATVEFVAAFLGLIGIIVAVTKLRSIAEDLRQFDLPISWSFILFLVAQLAFIAIGFLHLLDSLLKKLSERAAAPRTNVEFPGLPEKSRA